jgi:hypothetical protein
MIEESYYAEVESHFVERRGSPLFISPNEWQLVYEWEQMGVPIEVVKDGIDRVFERPKSRLRPRKLGYCRQTVAALYRRVREAGVGGRPAEASSPDEAESLASRLDELSDALLRTAAELPAGSEAFAATLGQAARRVRGLGPMLDPGERVENVEATLAELDRELLSGCESVVGETLRTSLEQQASSSLEPYRERMPAKVYRAALESAYRRRLRKELRLPVLSLYS